MNFRTPEIEHAAEERKKIRVRKMGSADEFPDSENRAIKRYVLGKGVSEAIRGLSEAIARLPKFASFFLDVRKLCCSRKVFSRSEHRPRVLIVGG